MATSPSLDPKSEQGGVVAILPPTAARESRGPFSGDTYGDCKGEAGGEGSPESPLKGCPAGPLRNILTRPLRVP